MNSMNSAIKAILAMFLLASACAAFGSSFTVGAQDDIFLSGGNQFTDGGGGIGNAPTATFAVMGGQSITFSNMSGLWSCCNGGNTFNGPDGGPYAGGSTDLNPTDGKIAGIVDSSHTMFLVGVFLGSSLPPVQPPRLDFSPNALTEHFLSLSPALGQVFFIGDGLTGTGTGDTQSFVAPEGAATLYLGVADGFQFTGLPGYYGDDVGSISGTINVGVPESGSIALVGAGLVGIAGMLRRKLR